MPHIALRGEEQRLRQPSPGNLRCAPAAPARRALGGRPRRALAGFARLDLRAGRIGKTRLLAAWVQQVKTRQPEPVIAWLTCHRSDHDLTPLRRALLRAAPPALAEALLEVPLLEDENTVRALSSALERHDGLVIMVLDDAHEVRGTALNHSVAALIAAVPPNVRFIVANRGAPPFRIARLRLDGRVLDLGPADLAFTRDEATRYFEGRRTLSEVELDDVMARTEGWAGGVPAPRAPAGRRRRGRRVESDHRIPPAGDIRGGAPRHAELPRPDPRSPKSSRPIWPRC